MSETKTMPTYWESKYTRGGVHGDMPNNAAFKRFDEGSVDERERFIAEARAELDSEGFEEFWDALKYDGWEKA
jgi:hypothetical protein